MKARIDKNETQKCPHSFFYTISNEVFCNECHERLGYFDPVKLLGFVKQTKDTIADEYLNKQTVKDVSVRKK